MKRIGAVLGACVALVALFLVLVPPVAGADPAMPHTGRVVISIDGNVTLPAGEHADAVIVVRGQATIAGEVNSIVVVDGSATLATGARSESIVAVRSPVELATGSSVSGDVFTVDSAVHQTGSAAIGGNVRNVVAELAGIGFILGPALLLFFAGMLLAAIAAGLLLAGLAARQVREAERLMRLEPANVVIAGLVGLFVPVVVAVFAIATIVGAPLGIGLVLFVWPIVAFLGYLVAGIAIGDWALERTRPDPIRERPYLAAVVGIVILQLITIIPPLAAIASFVGYGAVVLLGWRTLRGGSAAGAVATPRPLSPAPMPG